MKLVPLFDKVVLKQLVAEETTRFASILSISVAHMPDRQPLSAAYLLQVKLCLHCLGFSMVITPSLDTYSICYHHGFLLHHQKQR